MAAAALGCRNTGIDAKTSSTQLICFAKLSQKQKSNKIKKRQNCIDFWTIDTTLTIVLSLHQIYLLQ